MQKNSAFARMQLKQIIPQTHTNALLPSSGLGNFTVGKSPSGSACKNTKYFDSQWKIVKKSYKLQATVGYIRKAEH